MDSERHLQAASRHDAAAESHERLAALWHERGDSERASLQRALADHERQGATLERRWAALISEENGGAGARQSR
jgi:hypothetical protein